MVSRAAYWQPLAAILVILSGIVSAASPAIAAEGDDLRGFPALEGDWYVTQPAVEYEPAAPHGQIDESMKLQGLDVSYFLPSGGAPARGQGDISIAYFSDPDRTSNVATIDIGSFKDLEYDMGTSFVDGLVLPLADGTPHPLEYEFSGSVLTVTRTSEGCGRSDADSSYESQVALLGANEYKYLVDLSINLGDRPPCTPAMEAPPADRVPSGTPTPTNPAPTESVVDTPASQAPITTEEPADQPPVDSAESADVDSETVLNPQDWNWPHLLAAGVIVLILALSFAFFSKRRGAQKFRSNGTMASAPNAGGQSGTKNAPEAK